MKKSLVLFLPSLLLSISLYAQNNDRILVKAGRSLLDYIPSSERFLYPEFKTGKIFLKTNVYSQKKLNYNYLAGEIEYLRESDTLSILNKEDISFIAIAQDTFYFDKGYILQIRNSYPKIGLKELIEYEGLQQTDSYGISSQGSSRVSYNALPTDGSYYKLKSNQDVTFQWERVYYITGYDHDFVLFTRKNTMKLFPKHKKKINSFVKANNIKFDSREDLLHLADYLGTLLFVNGSD
jgi:hypothetical protein